MKFNVAKDIKKYAMFIMVISSWNIKQHGSHAKSTLTPVLRQ
jgi:hypothetical protein